MKRRGRLRITHEALAAALNFPSDHEILNVVPASAESIGHGFVEFVIEGPAIPEIPEGAALTLVSVADGEFSRFEW